MEGKLQILQDFGRPLITEGGRQSQKILDENIEIRRLIEELYPYYFHQKLCGSCRNKHFDALVQLVLLTPKKIEQIMDLKKSTNFAVRPGTLIRDVRNNNSALTLTAKNITDDLALYHLATNYDKVKDLFTKTPEGLDKLIKAKQKELASSEKTEKGISTSASALKTIADLEKKLAKAEAEKETAVKDAVAKAEAEKEDRIVTLETIMKESYGIDVQAEIQAYHDSKK